MHKGKIQFAQFCPSSNNILATSSNDKTVALWDIRTWGESVEPHPFAVLQHDAPINSGIIILNCKVQYCYYSMYFNAYGGTVMNQYMYILPYSSYLLLVLLFIAYFDPIYGSRLLTTTQNSKLCVFDAHNWETPSLTMTHPHRNFQHITHIKVVYF